MKEVQCTCSSPIPYRWKVLVDVERVLFFHESSLCSSSCPWMVTKSFWNYPAVSTTLTNNKSVNFLWSMQLRSLVNLGKEFLLAAGFGIGQLCEYTALNEDSPADNKPAAPFSRCHNPANAWLQYKLTECIVHASLPDESVYFPCTVLWGPWSFFKVMLIDNVSVNRYLIESFAASFSILCVGGRMFSISTLACSSRDGFITESANCWFRQKRSLLMILSFLDSGSDSRFGAFSILTEGGLKERVRRSRVDPIL